MFCAECGQKNEEGSAFCVNCGHSITSAVNTQPKDAHAVQPIQAVQPVQGYQASQTANTFSSGLYSSPSQTGPISYPPKAHKKSRKGLVIGIIVGAAALIAITAALLLFVWPGFLIAANNSKDKTSEDEISILGLWSNEERAEVMDFKKNGSVYIYTIDGKEKYEYEFDEKDGTGVLTLEDEEYDFEVDGDEADVKDLGVYTLVDEEDFDIDEFIEQAAPSLSNASEMTNSAGTTPASTTAAATAVTVQLETVTDLAITLSLAYGDRTGTYTGEMANGLPNGFGSFMSSNASGVAWQYEGEWLDGHCSGQGATAWEDGYRESGQYQNDLLNGFGQNYWYDMMRYEGYFTDGYQNGQGTLYNHHGEIIFSGNLNFGYIQETAEARASRVGTFKSQCVPTSMAELYQACDSQISVRAQITGTVFDVYEYNEDEQYFGDFLMYEQGVGDTDRIVRVSYRISEGELPITDGQTVTVWGTTEYLYSYTSKSDEYLTVPVVEAWSVE